MTILACRPLQASLPDAGPDKRVYPATSGIRVGWHSRAAAYSAAPAAAAVAGFVLARVAGLILGTAVTLNIRAGM
jgi:hypothetical protein